MQREQMENDLRIYRDGLLHDTLPFWLEHSLDREDGGFLFCLDRDGSVLGTDKPLWVHSRFVWLLATLCVEVELRDEWLALARHGLDFIEKYGFDTDGRMFFLVTKDGRPLRKRRYLFTEAFAVAAYAAYARAAHDPAAAARAKELFELLIRCHTTPGLLPPKFVPETRRLKALAMPMILIVTAQILREATADPMCDQWIGRAITEVEQVFMKEEFSAVLETTGSNGAFIDNFEGRMLCPGHAIELAWFILREAKSRNMDARLLQTGLKILDWSWRWGWDAEYGGIIYYRDVKGLPCTEYWHDMKFWWPQNEAIIAALLAYQLTGDEKYARWHRQAHDWAYARFPDAEYGEWFGYLHRDGRLSTRLKGNLWKGPFHLPRMQLTCWKMLQEMLAEP